MSENASYRFDCESVSERKMSYYDAAARSTCEKIGLGPILDEVTFHTEHSASQSRERIGRGVEIMAELIRLATNAPPDTSVVNVGYIIEREIRRHLDHVKGKDHVRGYARRGRPRSEENPGQVR